MILVDTSVWIGFLRGTISFSEEAPFHFVTCGPVVQEVLQGLDDTPKAFAFRESFLSIPSVSDPFRLATFLHAAEIYRLGRRKGYTIRSSTDCLIAAIAMENSLPVWHHDRDFFTIARYTGLEAITRL
jgi:predicted nucleic acid-binding protein